MEIWTYKPFTPDAEESDRVYYPKSIGDIKICSSLIKRNSFPIAWSDSF